MRSWRRFDDVVMTRRKSWKQHGGSFWWQWCAGKSVFEDTMRWIMTRMPLVVIDYDDIEREKSIINWWWHREKRQTSGSFWWQCDDNDADKSVSEDTMGAWWGELCPEWGSGKTNQTCYLTNDEDGVGVAAYLRVRKIFMHDKHDTRWHYRIWYIIMTYMAMMLKNVFVKTQWYFDEGPDLHIKYLCNNSIVY